MISLPLLCTFATVAAVFGLIAAEQCDSRRGKWITKPFASAAMCGTAWSLGAADSDYGRGILVALIFSFFGDIFLIPKSKNWFKAGLFAFLIGHITFGVTFWRRGADLFAAGGALVVLAALAFVVARWLLPHVENKMRGPVVAYIVAIALMVALAAGTVRAHGHAIILAAAVAFFLSDLSVARDTFVKRAFVNRLWGLPLYYGAQLLFAWSVVQ